MVCSWFAARLKAPICPDPVPAIRAGPSGGAPWWARRPGSERTSHGTPSVPEPSRLPARSDGSWASFDLAWPGRQAVADVGHAAGAWRCAPRVCAGWFGAPRLPCVCGDPCAGASCRALWVWATFRGAGRRSRSEEERDTGARRRDSRVRPPCVGPWLAASRVRGLVARARQRLRRGQDAARTRGPRPRASRCDAPVHDAGPAGPGVEHGCAVAGLWGRSSQIERAAQAQSG